MNLWTLTNHQPITLCGLVSDVARILEQSIEGVIPLVLYLSCGILFLSPSLPFFGECICGCLPLYMLLDESSAISHQRLEAMRNVSGVRRIAKAHQPPPAPKQCEWRRIPSGWDDNIKNAFGWRQVLRNARDPDIHRTSLRNIWWGGRRTYFTMRISNAYYKEIIYLWVRWNPHLMLPVVSFHIFAPVFMDTHHSHDYAFNMGAQ